MKKRFLPSNVIILIVLAVIWGSSYILMKRGLESFSALQVSLLRIFFAFAALLPFLPSALKNLKKKDIIFIAAVAIIGSGIPSYLYPLAITKVDSGVAGIINTLTPVFVLLFGFVFFQMKAGWKRVLGVSIALVGAALLVWFKPGVAAGSVGINHYALAAVAATACYGLSSNILKARLNHVPAGQLTSLTFTMIGPFALAWLFSTDFMSILEADPEAYKSLAYIALLGVFGTAFALVLFNKLIAATDALYAATVTFLIPIVAIFWAIIDGEILGAAHIAGLTLILVGLFLLNRAKREDESLNS